ncbi:MAG: hypothetical protein H7X91_08370 [Burkholderiales bacterium]|nr:hypothetical protein [Burkholderiales bacterium]
MNTLRHELIALLTAASCCLAATQAAAATTAASPSPILLSVEAGLINAKIERAPLKDVLAALAREVSLTVQIGAAEAQRPVTVTLKDALLHQGLQEILREMSYTISYTAKRSPRGERITKPSALAIKLVVLSPSGTDASAARPIEIRSDAAPDWDNPPLEQLAAAASQSPQPEARIDALEDYSYGAQSTESLAMLEGALADEKPDVRIAALDLMKDSNDSIPLDAVNQLIRLDTDAAVRGRALALLAERAEPAVAKPSIEAALNDSAPEVRTLAKSLMADLGLAQDPE